MGEVCIVPGRSTSPILKVWTEGDVTWAKQPIVPPLATDCIPCRPHPPGVRRPRQSRRRHPARLVGLDIDPGHDQTSAAVDNPHRDAEASIPEFAVPTPVYLQYRHNVAQDSPPFKTGNFSD